jgi:hypothetical protein
MDERESGQALPPFRDERVPPAATVDALAQQILDRRKVAARLDACDDACQLLRRRGLNRRTWRSLSMRRSFPSIHPKHGDFSTASLREMHD